MKISLDESNQYIDAVIKEGEQDTDYDNMMAILRTAPTEEGKLPRLKYPELTWEMYTPTDTDDLTAEESLEILLGGES